MDSTHFRFLKMALYQTRLILKEIIQEYPFQKCYTCVVPVLLTISKQTHLYIDISLLKRILHMLFLKMFFSSSSGRDMWDTDVNVSESRYSEPLSLRWEIWEVTTNSRQLILVPVYLKE